MNVNSVVRTGIVTLLILSVPLIAMQFSEEWDWSFSDFVIMGTLISGTGLLLDYVMRKVDKKYRLLAVIGIILAFFLLWAELAVGVFGSPLAGN